MEAIKHEATGKKRKRQDKQKVKMVKRQQEAIDAIAGKVGDLVSIKMDPREATKAQGIVGVVIDAAAHGTGGCRVVTDPQCHTHEQQQQTVKNCKVQSSQ